MKHVYITHGAFYHDITQMFVDKGFIPTRDLDKADILCLSGGNDIDSALYGENPVQTYGIDRARDAHEIAVWNEAVGRGLFVFGICRGGQLANVLSGGRLWQHIEGHPGKHTITDKRTGEIILASSIHHQAFKPGPGCEIIATCNHANFKVSEFETWKAGDCENEDVEVCWYPKTRSLCIQGHPEVGPDQFTDYCFNLMKELAA
jgi:carbamoylphosphate synthase small subunit